MSYQKMAYVYDALMEDAPYNLWEQMTLAIFNQYGENIQTVADLGCGTGEITRRLANHNYKMYGVDMSLDMLSYAEHANETQTNSVMWIRQDIRQLDGFEELDAIISYCDVMNYIVKLSDIQSVFKRVKTSLKIGGLFIFDVHSLNHVEQNLKGQTFAEVYDDLSYIWFCESGENDGEVFHDLTFFVLEGNQYERFDETHHQRTYSVNTYKELLEQTGFSLKAIFGDFDISNQLDEQKNQRIFFVCQA
ncbi:class I SAM-dependent DNA methyltransferase [Aquibacillus salsiterrae]|uniref:Class I SAM-dependent methyltransferase n=1 Tax=Aquibacillus salsiterrae TaxID=2950439 RepID=A0A9X4ADM3_9BACI|nr:class I SAM-dependent methyltransferase [Aquibacillus salsiterrae]MDC3415586.1 class I SAM-dependent methyltransferase [Aquibacillus salsiterrae]